MRLKNILCGIVLCLTLTACYQDEPTTESVVRLTNLDESSDDNVTRKKTIIPLDSFINERFTKPYNLEVEYKFLERKHSKNYYLEPASYEKSVLFCNMLDYLYFQPYKRVVPPRVLEQKSIKQILLAGSPGYTSEGAVTYGLTTNASTIAIYAVNNIDLTKVSTIKTRYMKTLYHESIHLLHHEIEYPPIYKELSALDYKQDDKFRYWTRTGESYLKAGFITEYASDNSDEDFAELIAWYIIDTEDEWNQKLKEADGKNNPNARFTGKQLLERKLQIAKDYLLSTWQFDLDKVRTEVQLQYTHLADVDLTQLNSTAR